MIVNLIGPPGAGKSTFAARFVLEHPEFVYCPIDEYRIRYKNEPQAWGKMLEDVVNNPEVVVETCGLSYRLNDIWNAEIVRRQRIFTVRFDVQDPKILFNRLTERNKREVPLPAHLTTELEIPAAHYFWENMDRCATPVDFTVWTDQGLGPAEQYQDVVNAINQARLESLGQKERRAERIDNPILGKLAEI
jgi:adenylate kinase family enzyme